MLIVGPVSVAKHPGNLPARLLMLPHDYELGESIALTGRELTEPMSALLNGAEVLDWESLESPRDKFATEIATHVFPGISDHRLASPGDTTHVVIELNVRRKEAGVFLELLRRTAFVERVEYSRIKRSDRVEQGIGR